MDYLKQTNRIYLTINIGVMDMSKVEISESRKQRIETMLKLGKIIVCDKGTVDVTAILAVVKEQFSLGEGSGIGRGCEVTGIVKIGNNTQIGYGAMIISEEHLFLPEYPIFEQSSVYKPIIIGDDVWVCARAIITGGVTIGNHAIVCAGAIVTHDVPEWEIWAGNPAKKIGDRRTWHK
jgi:acetyltransferase-like isoleucine patch superfamily enzyme